ncbi:MAG: peptidoglycan-binding protein [Myxococcota bacterium]
MDATAIRDLQRHLSQLGLRPGPLDGIWGPRTKAALQVFQRRARVVAHGRFDPQAEQQLRLHLGQSEMRIGSVTLNLVRSVTPAFPEAWLAPLNKSIHWAHITVARVPAYIAQLAHESAHFRTLEEYASGEAYEGRRDLGNTQPGDGPRFKGRGAIQITGRRNYTRAGAALGLPLAERPELLLEPENGFMASAWYWLDANLNHFVDTSDFKGLTRAINGGFNGLDDRRRLLQRAQRELSGLAPDAVGRC